LCQGNDSPYTDHHRACLVVHMDLCSCGFRSTATFHLAFHKLSRIILMLNSPFVLDSDFCVRLAKDSRLPYERSDLVFAIASQESALRLDPPNTEETRKA